MTGGGLDRDRHVSTANENDVLRVQRAVREAFADVGMRRGVTRKQIRNLLLDIEGCDALVDERLAVVDDMALPYVVQWYGSRFIAATRNHLALLQYRGEPAAEFGKRVMEFVDTYHSTLVLMDYCLDGERRRIWGSDVVQHCLTQGTPALFAGFTDLKATTSDAADLFREAGAIGTLEKAFMRIPAKETVWKADALVGGWKKRCMPTSCD